MAEVVRTFPTEAAWDDWLDGGVWKLEEGKDFSDVVSFRASAYAAARRRNIRVRLITAHEEGKTAVYLQARKATNGHRTR